MVCGLWRRREHDLHEFFTAVSYVKAGLTLFSCLESRDSGWLLLEERMSLHVQLTPCCCHKDSMCGQLGFLFSIRASCSNAKRKVKTEACCTRAVHGTVTMAILSCNERQPCSSREKDHWQKSLGRPLWVEGFIWEVTRKPALASHERWMVGDSGSKYFSAQHRVELWDLQPQDVQMVTNLWVFKGV